MMGHRGCRLAVTYPEIAKMQTKAVIRAAINVQKKHADWTVKPEIMIPLGLRSKRVKIRKKMLLLRQQMLRSQQQVSNLSMK